MTPISSTARAEAEAERAGFTLVELLIVVAIIGMAAAAVVLNLPDPRPSVGTETERFAARLVRAREEAVLSNRTIAAEVTTTGYGFQTFDGAWVPLNDAPFKSEVWAEDMTVTLADKAARTVFDPTGVADPLRVTLRRRGVSRTVVVDAAGEVSLAP